MEKNLILIDELSGGIIGYEEKMRTHKLGLFHCAFSVFLFDRKRQLMLIQRRDRTKYHSGGLLSNSCCSHLTRNESWTMALSRCIQDELGIQPSFPPSDRPEADSMPPLPQLTKELQFAGAFPYRAGLGSLIENELDYVFLYCPSEELIAAIHAQPGEVEALYWISIETLDQMQSECPQEFTAWFWQAYRTVRGAIPVSF